MTRLALCVGFFAVLAMDGAFTNAASGQSAPIMTASNLPVKPGVRAKPAPDIVRLPSIAITGSPRTYQVVSVPVPDALAQSAEIEVSIKPVGEFSCLGARTRTINVQRGQRVVGVTLGIPASARAGKRLAAEVTFSVPGAPTMVVPVEIDVSRMRSVALRPPGTVNAQAGNDVVLPFEVANLGNGIEQLTTELTVPGGWSSRDIKETSTITLAPGESSTQKVRLKVPALASTGTSFVHVDVLAGSDTLATRTMSIEVFNSGSVARRSGPLVITGLTHVVDENGQPNDLVTITANGALFDSVRVDGRVSIGSPPGPAAGYAYAHLATYQSPATVLFSAPQGQLGLGLTGTSFSELTGMYTYGQGGLLHLTRRNWNVLALGALSLRTPFTTGREPMLGFRAEHRLGVGSVSSSISHLADAGPYPRRLDALGLGAAMPVILDGMLRLEVAERRYQGGDGVGWSSELSRYVGDNTVQLRATHAPGGSDAFARATEELLGNISQRIGSRMVLGASGWRTTDATSIFSSLETKGFAVRPQFTLARATTLALEARSYFYNAASRSTAFTTTPDFGSREDQLGAIFSTNVRQFYLNTTGYLGHFTRTVSAAGQPGASERVPRNFLTAAAGWSGVPGFLEMQARIEQTRNHAGFVLQQNMFGIRGDRVVLPWLRGIRAGGELQRVIGFGDWRSSAVRAGLALPLTNGFAFRVDIERNTIFRASDGKVPWIFGARFEHGRTLPMIRAPGTSGYVYRDLNGNRHRDDGEPGVAGVIVRRGTQTAVADASGKYHVGGDGRREITVDEASLPEGWSQNTVSRGDFGLIQSSDAEINLFVAPRSGTTPVEIDLSRAHIVARDSSGREWSATMVGPSTASFMALPVGTYRLELDLSDISEPLVPRTPIPLLIIVSPATKPVTVTLDPRPVRIWEGNGRGDSQRKAAPRPEQPSGPKGGGP